MGVDENINSGGIARYHTPAVEPLKLSHTYTHRHTAYTWHTHTLVVLLLITGTYKSCEVHRWDYLAETHAHV